MTLKAELERIWRDWPGCLYAGARTGWRIMSDIDTDLATVAPIKGETVGNYPLRSLRQKQRNRLDKGYGHGASKHKSTMGTRPRKSAKVKGV